MAARTTIIVSLVVCLLQCTFGFHFFEPPMNYIFGLEDNYYCPWYRNLLRHVPLPPKEKEGCPARDQRNENCLADMDCPEGSYCCFYICQGVTRCYNPLTNDFADRIPKNSTRQPCVYSHPVEPVSCEASKRSTEIPTNPSQTATKKPTTVKQDDDEADPRGFIKTADNKFINEDDV